jgi:DNA-directed RNA polymerase subunit RPC12/RpoP/outer membrane biosynthesis protein TonB
MQAKTYAIIVAIISLAALASLTAAEARSDITVTVEFSGMECVGVAAITPYPGKLQLTGQRIYTVSVGNLTSGDVVSLEVVISDLKRCRVEGVFGALAWFIDRDKLYANIMLKEGENKVYVKFSYTPPKRVYASVNATNPECVAELTANAPVNKVSGGWVVGPWTDGDMAELSATPSDRCYIGGWMSGVKALTTSSFYSFQALENITLTLSAERRGTMPPPSLIDFSIVSVRATGPGKVVVSSKPIATGVGTPLWQAVLNPGTTIYVEAVPEGCGEFRGWRGTDKLKTVDTPSLTIITEPGYLDVEAVFENMRGCPYIVIGPYRILRVDEVPVVAAVVGGGSTGLLVYRMVRAGRRQRKTLDELMPRWSDEMLSSIASYTTGHPYAMIANLVREYMPPETPTEYVYIFRAYRDGKLSDILRDLDRCDSASTVLFTISEYRMVRLRYASEQGYMAGRLLTAYISLKGYAPVTRKILYEWVSRMLAVSSREKAEHNIELLWRDREIVNLQKNAVEEVIRELSKEGLENLAINPPKPIQKVLETLIKCPGCGSQPSYGEKYCKQCGASIPTKAWEITEETHKPVTVEIEQKAGTPTIECPYCGKELPPHAKYCTKCGASIVSPARERGGIREIFRRIQQDVSRKTTPEEPAPGLEREVSPESAEKTTPQAFKEHVKGEEKPSQAEEHVKPTAEKPVAEREPRTPTDVGEKPQPQQPILPTRRITAEESVPVGVDWEPDEDMVEAFDDMGVPLEAFRREAIRLALLDVDERVFEREVMRSASKLATSVEGLNRDFRDQLTLSISQYLRDAVFIIRKEIKRPETPRPTVPEHIMSEKPAQPALEPPKHVIQQPKPPEQLEKRAPTVESAKQQPPKMDRIELWTLVREGPKPGYVYLLDLPRSAVPTSLISKMFEGVVNVEEVDYVGPDTPIALTRTTYRANYKSLIKPSPTHPYAKKLYRIVDMRCGSCIITTLETYLMNRDVFDSRGLKPLKVILDIEASRKALEKVMHPQYAARLAKLGALLPWLAEELASNGLEGVRNRLHGLLGPEDGEEVYQAIKGVLENDMRYVNKALAISLGIIDEEE